MIEYRLSRSRWYAWSVAVVMLGVIAPISAQTSSVSKPPQKVRYTVPELVRTMGPAVVFVGNVNAKGEVSSFGSGFVVNADGVIVTNYHVIKGAQGLQVKMKDGEIYDRVEVLDYDVRRDIAVLKIRVFKRLPTVTLADETPEPGDDAVAIGNPQGLEHTVSTGIISAYRQAEGYRLLQISVPISPGSSGGPLFGLDGKVLGITTAGVVAEGAQNLNFAMPVEYVRPLITSTATPMPIVEFTKKMSATTGSAGAQPSRKQSADGDIFGIWQVAHDHGDAFSTFCLGRLYVATDRIGYRNDSGVHNWEVPLSAVREAAKNGLYASEKGAFHIRLTTNTNYNFVAINDQLQFTGPDAILIAIMKVIK